MPTVQVAAFDDMVIEEPVVRIDEKDLEVELKKIQERNALVIDKADDEAAVSGDIATIDYKAVDADGVEIDDGSREDFVLTLGDSYSYYEFDSGITGMKKGETKTIEKTYPADSSRSALAGKTLRFTVTLKQLKRRDLPAIDDDLAQDVSEKYTTLADLKADIRKRLEVQRDEVLRNIKIDSLLMELVKRNPVDLPRSMITRQAESQWEEMTSMFSVQVRGPDSSLLNLKKEMFPNIERSAAIKLKQTLILQTLANEQKYKLTPEDFETEYARIAALEDVPVERIKESFEKPEEKEHLSRLIEENKLVASLFSKVTVKAGKKMSFDELLEASQKDSADEEVLAETKKDKKTEK
jgi:trigger factor